MAEKNGPGQLYDIDVETGSSSKNSEIGSEATPTTPDEELKLEENSTTPLRKSKNLGILLNDLILRSEARFPVCFIIRQILRPEKWTIRVLFEWTALVCFNGCLIASLTMHNLQNHLVWKLKLWKWCVLPMVVLCGRLIAEILGNAIFWSTQWLFKGKLKVLYIVYGFKLMSSVFVWWSMVLVAWLVLVVMDENGNGGARRLRSKETRRMLDHVTRVLAYLLIGSGLWLVKDVLQWSFALSFQHESLFYRILKAMFFKWVIMKFSESNIASMPKYIHQIKWAHEMKGAKVSAVLIKLFTDVIIDAKMLSLEESVEKKLQGFLGSNSTITEDLISKYFINGDDVVWWFELVEKTLERKIGIISTSNGIQRGDFNEWLGNVSQECKLLETSLNNTAKAMNELNKLASGIIIALIIIVLLLVMKVFPTNAVSLMLQVLVLSFVFGDTIKKIFEGIIFVFVTHPFDVGDCCAIENGEQIYVKKINIHTTVFSRDRVVANLNKDDYYDTQKNDREKIVYPNSVLATKYIRNFHKIPPPPMTVEFVVDASTSIKKIRDLKARIESDMKTNEWIKDICVHANGFESGDKIKMAVYVNHKDLGTNNRSNEWTKSEMVLGLKQILEDMRISNFTPQVELANVPLLNDDSL